MGSVNMNVTQTQGKYVIHFLEIEKTDWETDGINAVTNAYARALHNARKYGGRKFHNKSYGGGIAFDSMKALTACIENTNTNKGE
jgi:hypothetical protein